ncbi:MAG: hypothetical protein ACI915_005168 [Gammaproteobacteria bacterium]|jgi:hypothetical protein
MTLSLISAGLLICCVSLTASAAGINKWTDAQGNVHFGDQPPAQAIELHTPTRAAPEPGSDEAKAIESSSIEAQLERTNLLGHPAKTAKARTRGNPSIRNRRIAGLERWKSEFVKKCKTNHGANCGSPSYQDDHRPLTAEEQVNVQDAIHARRRRGY